jgi:hypothetical protein
MLSGNEVYDNYVSKYEFLFQMETDVYPIRDGWIDELKRIPKSGNAEIIFGSPVRETMFFHSRNRSCENSSFHYDYVRNHINGNALYKISDSLQESLQRSIKTKPNWPFDLGLYLSLKDDNNLRLYGYREFILNRVTPIDIKLALNPALYTDSIFLVHISSYLTNDDSKWDAIKCKRRKESNILLLYLLRHTDDLSRIRQTIVQQKQLAIEVVYISCTRRTTDLLMKMASRNIMYLEDLRCKSLDLHYKNLCKGISCIFVEGSSIVTNRGLSEVEKRVKGSIGITRQTASDFTGIKISSVNLPIKAGILFFPNDKQLYSLVTQHGNFIGTLYDSKFCKERCQIGEIPLQDISMDLYAYEKDFDLGFSAKALDFDKTFLLGASHYLNPNQRSLALQQFMLHNDIQLPQSCENVVLLAKKTLRVSGLPCSTQGVTNGILKLVDFARRNKCDCILLPKIYDHVLDTFVNVERIFSLDQIRELSGVSLVLESDSLNLLPRPPKRITEVKFDSGCRMRNIPTQIFSDAIQIIARLAKIDQVEICLMDIQRPLEQVTLNYLAGDLKRITLFQDSNAAYVAGKWRMLGKRLGSKMPFKTLFHVLPTEDVAAPVDSLYHRDGEDYIYDFIDILVCSKIGTQTAFPIEIDSTRQMYEKLLRHIPGKILEEEKSYWPLYDGSDSPTIIGRDLMINNGLSNLEGSSQCLRFLAGVMNISAALVPMYQQHLKSNLSAWSTIYRMKPFIGMQRWRSTIYPLLRHPSMIFEIFDGMMIPVTGTELYEHAPDIKRFWISVGESIKSLKLYQNIYIARNLEDFKENVYSGKTCLMGDIPHLGIQVRQASWLQKKFSHRDIALFKSFRSVSISSKSVYAINFRHIWREHIQINEALNAMTVQMLNRIGDSYTCIHLRLNQEFLVLMDGRPFGEDEALHRLNSKLLPGMNVFVISDNSSNVKRVRDMFPKSNVHSSSDMENFDELALQQRVVAEKHVCSLAQDFWGNIYSSFTLSICGMRNDQKCRDLFGNELKDSRLLI